MKRLLLFLRQYIKESILAPLFKMLEALLDLAVPVLVARIVDEGITGNNTAVVWKYCLWMVALGIVGLAVAIVAQYYAAKAAVGTSAAIRSSLFSKVQSLSYSELDQVGTSTLINRMTNDVGQVQTGINMFLRLFLRSPFIVFGAMIMAFTIDTPSALIFVVTIPVLSIVVFGIILSTIPLYRGVQKRLDLVLRRTRQNLTGVRVIRAFGKEETEIEGYETENAGLVKAQKFVGGLSGLMNPMTYVILNLAIVMLIRAGAVRVNSGAITQGQLIALYNYMSQILVELIKLANLIVTLTRAYACLKRVNQVLDMSSSLECHGQQVPAVMDGSVDFYNVHMRYAGGGADALSGINFHAQGGETIGIIGGTGSGKSSLVNLIPHFYDCSEGSVCVDGMNVKEMELEALRNQIGIVPQKAVLFKGTIRDNLLWGNPNASDEELWEALEAAQAAGVVRGKEGQLDAMVEQEGRNYSGGQKQRLTIARALVRKPQILILDDSSSALDFATEAALRKSLKQLSWHPTIFIVSQRTSSIMHADQIIVLDDGMVAGIGQHEDLVRGCQVYSEIYAAQTKGGESHA